MKISEIPSWLTLLTERYARILYVNIIGKIISIVYAYRSLGILTSLPRRKLSLVIVPYRSQGRTVYQSSLFLLQSRIYYSDFGRR